MIHHERKKRWKTLLLLLLLGSLRELNLSTLTFAFLSPQSSPRHHAETGFSARFRTSLLATTLDEQKLEEKLESMTVKDLRQLIKDRKLNQRGTLSQLKLKKDLISFLKTHLQVQRPVEEANGKRADTVHAEASLSQAPNPGVISGHSKKPMSMPEPANGKSLTSGSPKDILFDKVLKQYPPLSDPSYSHLDMIDENDIRQSFHPIFQDSKESSDLDVVFVGTASCAPSVTRGVSCTALRLHWNPRPTGGVPPSLEATDANAFIGGTWLFDCGECTQLQVQRTSSIKPGKINKIFITHAHGDHSFGLPGLLCLMGQDRDREKAPPVEIYGPEGLRMWLRVAIRYSVSRIVPNYRVHELKDIPMAPEWQLNRRTGRYFYKGARQASESPQWGYQGFAGEDPETWLSRANMVNLEPSSRYGEIPGGRDIPPIYNHPASVDGAPVWEVEDEGDVKVHAAPMSHGIPCVGYVVEEMSKPGRLRSEYVTPIVKRNLQALKDNGFKIPMRAMEVIKNLPLGGSFTFPDGTVVSQEEGVEPPRKGRKVVICGDTASSRAIEGLSMDADVVIHEATNTYLPGIDRETNIKAVTRDAIVHGHSTPYIAGEFARRVRAKKLLVNHFSARYKGDASLDSMAIMTRIESQAKKSSGLTRSDIAAAWDFMKLPVHRQE